MYKDVYKDGTRLCTVPYVYPPSIPAQRLAPRWAAAGRGARAGAPLPALEDALGAVARSQTRRGLGEESERTRRGLGEDSGRHACAWRRGLGEHRRAPPPSVAPAPKPPPPSRPRSPRATRPRPGGYPAPPRRARPARAGGRPRPSLADWACDVWRASELGVTTVSRPGPESREAAVPARRRPAPAEPPLAPGARERRRAWGELRGLG